MEKSKIREKEEILGHHRPFVIMKSNSDSEDVHYSAMYEGLPKEFKKVAETELNETRDKQERCLQHLKECMMRESSIVLKDELILAVLRVCKYDMKKAETKLKRFLVTYEDLVQRLKRMHMETVEKIIDDMPFGVLPYRDKHGRVICYSRPNGFHLESYELRDVMTVAIAMLNFLLSYPLTSVTGGVYYGECKIHSAHLLYSLINELRRNLFKLTTIPGRLARVEVLNETYFIRCFAIFVRSFVPAKIVGRITLHGNDFRALHEDYHPDILPEEFGGNMGPLNNDVYRERLLDFIRDLRKEIDDL